MKTESLAWYNEPDKFKAEWLRQLILAGLIAPGDVDERSIVDVRPGDLSGYTQCHFFAGIGIWSLALRNAGWPDTRPCWTGSCPCPSFSAAGKGQGFDDDRHLWPVWHTLISECRPPVLFGEQADKAVGFGWLDLVSGNLEAAGYAVAAAVLGAHSVGAPHRRQRLYFCADIRSSGEPSHGFDPNGTRSLTGRRAIASLGHGNAPESTGCADNNTDASESRRGTRLNDDDARQPDVEGYGGSLGGEHSFQSRLEGHFGDVREWRGPGWLDPHTARSVAEAGATRGFWADCDWWYGRDGKFRPIGPGLQPLVNGCSSRVGRLRGFGDCIVAPQAEEFIRAYIEAREGGG